MKFISTRIITADVDQLVDFYETVTGFSAVWGNELFAEISTPAGTLAIGSEKTVALFGAGSLLIRDPDGNLVNLFTPVTDAARAKFGV
jgi:hypothetical protein